MTNATDIITYIGVPLAVLGVLPILYTFCLAFITQRRIRHTLIQNGHRPLTSRNNQHGDGFYVRSSPMTTLLEVELPQFTIAPLDRHSKNYWKLSQEAELRAAAQQEHHKLLELDRTESTLSMVEEGRVRGFLRGGSWRAFNWRKLVVGKKLYRIQYEDELREPPAEVDFSDLLHYLLDWGAEADAMGWEKLRSGGLWTPAGTILLRMGSPDEKDNIKARAADWILRTSVPDESDGVLTLCVRWPADQQDVETSRGAASLPPGWGRLYQPEPMELEVEPDAKDNTASKRRDLPTRIDEYKLSSKKNLDNKNSNSLRFRADNGVVSRIYWEVQNIENGFDSDLFHIAERDLGQEWFTCAASAILLGKDGSGALWGFSTPHDITHFVRKDSVPCGVMVLLGLIPEDSAPHWTEVANHDRDLANRSRLLLQQHEARRAAERLEASMPAAQAQVHKRNREAQERQRMMEDTIKMSQARTEREERRVRDALVSVRMSTKAVAEGCLAWLIDQGEIGRDWTVDQVTRAVLFLLVVDEREDGEGPKVLKILEEWMNWTNVGGMKQQQLQFLQDNKLEFCFAACLVATVMRASLDSADQAGKDMLECLKMWPKVRLG